MLGQSAEMKTSGLIQSCPKCGSEVVSDALAIHCPSPEGHLPPPRYQFACENPECCHQWTWRPTP